MIKSKTSRLIAARNALARPALLGLLIVAAAAVSCARLAGRDLPWLPETVGLAAYPGPDLLIDIPTARAKLAVGARVIDVRARDEYTSGHLPGAINIPARLWRSAEPQLQLFHVDGDPEQPFDIARYERLLGDRGITQDDEVIIYGSPGRDMAVAVPLFVLDWLGHERKHLIDGDAVQLWAAAGGTLELARSRLEMTTYKAARPRADIVWDRRQVRQVALSVKEQDVVLWDCRHPDVYQGKFIITGAKRAGHIPQAVNFDMFDLFREDITFQTRFYHEMAILLGKKGISKDKQIVIYCHSGAAATHCYLVLRMMDYPRVAIYDNSWLEWGNDVKAVAREKRGELKIETAPSPATPAAEPQAPKTRDWWSPRT
ncbi:sulfurtransferase [Candidatus Sumerlaeota bacterium]